MKRCSTTHLVGGIKIPGRLRFQFSSLNWAKSKNSTKSKQHGKALEKQALSLIAGGNAK